MNGTILSNVPIATHLGMKRGKTVKETLEHTVNENIQKARWTAYIQIYRQLYFDSACQQHNNISSRELFTEYKNI